MGNVFRLHINVKLLANIAVLLLDIILFIMHCSVAFVGCVGYNSEHCILQDLVHFRWDLRRLPQGLVRSAVKGVLRVGAGGG